MFVKSIEEMEEIVASRKFLHWDGWTVVQTFQTDKARTAKNGIFRNGRWYLQKRFEVTDKGWNIPEKLLASKGKRESK